KARVPFSQRHHPFRHIVTDHAEGDSLGLALSALANPRQLKFYLIDIAIEQSHPAPLRNRVRHSPKYGTRRINRLHGLKHSWVQSQVGAGVREGICPRIKRIDTHWMRQHEKQPEARNPRSFASGARCSCGDAAYATEI